MKSKMFQLLTNGHEERHCILCSFLFISIGYGAFVLFLRKIAEKYMVITIYASVVMLLTYGIAVSTVKPYMAATMFPLLLALVAFAYSAITLSRTYKASQSYGEAVEELHIVAGQQLDEELVDIFCSIPVEQVNECMNDVVRELTSIKNCGVEKQ